MPLGWFHKNKTSLSKFAKKFQVSNALCSVGIYSISDASQLSQTIEAEPPGGVEAEPPGGVEAEPPGGGTQTQAKCVTEASSDQAVKCPKKSSYTVTIVPEECPPCVPIAIVPKGNTHSVTIIPKENTPSALTTTTTCSETTCNNRKKVLKHFIKPFYHVLK